MPAVGGPPPTMPVNRTPSTSPTTLGSARLVARVAGRPWAPTPLACAREPTPSRTRHAPVAVAPAPARLIPDGPAVRYDCDQWPREGTEEAVKRRLVAEVRQRRGQRAQPTAGILGSPSVKTTRPAGSGATTGKAVGAEPAGVGRHGRASISSERGGGAARAITRR